MRLLAPLAGAAAAVAAAGCGGGAEQGPLRVAAASSLRAALTQHVAGEDVSLSFAGSDKIAARIRQGVRPDVFVSADPELPDGLHAEGLVQEPVPVASNRLVVAVPADASSVTSLDDLGRPDVRIAIAAEGVPAGDHARRALSPAARANVRSEEPDVAGVAGKVAQGAVDAGVVYATDVRAAGGRLRQIGLPGAPPVRYAAAVVRPGERAHAFVEGLRDAAALRAAGFGPP